MLISPLCDQTIFVDTDKKNYMEGIELLLNNSNNLQLVTSYGSYYNYSTNDDINNIKYYVSTKDFCCPTYYSLNNNKSKNNKNESYFEIGFFIMFIILFPLFALYHFFKFIWRCLCGESNKYIFK
jgi:hypothetical protein